MDSVNLSSSLGNTSFTCPGESALFFCRACLTSGLLIWQVDNETLITFSKSDYVDAARTCRNDSRSLCGPKCFIISGILNDMQTSRNVSYFYSTLVITPKEPSDTTSELYMSPNNCTAENLEMNFNVSCIITDDNEMKSLPYRAAGIMINYIQHNRLEN